MKVLFLEDVENVAKAGQVKEVAAGYARNFLLPKKLAIAATAEALRGWEQGRQTVARHEAEARAHALALAAKLEARSVVIRARVGKDDRLYGSVTAAHIATELARLVGEPIERRHLELGEPIRTVGSHTILARLFRDVTATITVVVEAEKA